ncbi:hypothetical protein [Pseudomonas syringae]|uniref:hypothetical protein n=1 Tax=Pseudomonas syringae TaxID=317 RepID=UPI00245D0023|nr:hypothetical protein [Pseudomonas syringae]MDH4602465.1 hypothetical protein [Pseudomonas syringae pv. papulans]
MSNITQTSMDLASHLTELMRSLQAMKTAVMSPGAVGKGLVFDQLSGEAIAGDLPNLLAHALTSIEVAEGSANGSVVRFPGCFEVSQSVIEHADCLNAAKENFKLCVKDLEESGLKPHELRGIYRKLGHSRIHPLQAWRKVNVVNGAGLESIGFSVAKSTEGIEALTFSELVARLEAANASDVIEALLADRAPAQVQWHTPVSRHIRANIVWKNDQLRTSAMLHASMPFLIPQGSWPTKRVRFNQPRSHAKRSDSRANNVVHLPFRAGAYISWA